MYVNLFRQFNIESPQTKCLSGKPRYISLTLSPLNQPSASESYRPPLCWICVCLQKKCFRITFLCEFGSGAKRGVDLLASEADSSALASLLSPSISLLSLNEHKPSEFCIWSYSSPKVSSKLAAHKSWWQIMFTQKSHHTIFSLPSHSPQTFSLALVGLFQTRIQKIHIFVVFFMILYFFLETRRERRDKEWWTDISGQIILSVKGRCF